MCILTTFTSALTVSESYIFLEDFLGLFYLSLSEFQVALGIFLKTYFLSLPEALEIFWGYFSRIFSFALLNFFSDLELIFLVRQRRCTNFPQLRTYFLGTPEVLLKSSPDFDPIISEGRRLLRFFSSW